MTGHTSNQRPRRSDGRFARSVRTFSLPPPSAAPSLSPEGRELGAVVAQAKALAGEEWGAIRTWPLESGLVFLAEKLKG